MPETTDFLDRNLDRNPDRNSDHNTDRDPQRSVERRDFLKMVGAAGSALALGCRDATLERAGSSTDADSAPAASASSDTSDTSDASEAPIPSESRTAFGELVELMSEIDRRYVGPEKGLTRAADIADGHRYVLHTLSGGLDFYFGTEAANPLLERIVSPTRKFLGDNPDAIYFTCPVTAEHRYRVRGNTAGAVYTSFTIESGSADGSYATRVSSDINDGQIDIAPDGSFELILSATREPGNWLELEPDAGTLTTRHYFEEVRSAAGDPTRHVPLTIERISPAGAPPVQDDAFVAENIRRVARYLRGRTLDEPSRDPENQPAWVSTVPNVFNQPEKPGDLAFAAVDQAYAMAPYVVMPDEALIIEGRFPECRFANIALWDRMLQTYDYVNRTVSLNRKQTKTDEQGHYRMIVAHRNPGPSEPNWLDASGRVSGIMYWRFMLPEGEIEKPRTKLVKLADL